MTIDVLKALPDTRRSTLLPNLGRSRTSVRRSLFGEVDHEESMAFLQKELESIHRNQTKRWNFDFHNEKPLNSDDGNYEWTPVQPSDNVPKAYALSRLPFLYANSTDQNQNEAECSSAEEVLGVSHSITVQGSNDESHVELRLRDTEVISDDDNLVTKKVRVQKSMLDFLTTKKRPSSVSLKTQKEKSPLPDSTSNNRADETEADEFISYHENSSAKRKRLC